MKLYNNVYDVTAVCRVHKRLVLLSVFPSYFPLIIFFHIILMHAITR